MMTFAQRLRALKKGKGVSYSRMEKETGISIAMLYRYASDRTEPRLSYLIWLADYFGVTTDYLLGWED